MADLAVTLQVTIDEIKTRKGVPEFLSPALVCLSALDKKVGLIFCKHNCIDCPQEPES